MAEGAPLLREYTFYSVSRVRIPLSPPFQVKIKLHSRIILNQCINSLQERDLNPGFDKRRTPFGQRSNAALGQRPEALAESIPLSPPFQVKIKLHSRIILNQCINSLQERDLNPGFDKRRTPAYSRASLPLVPRQSCHLFQSKSATKIWGDRAS